MNILALDLATKTGWAVIELGRIESGVESFDVGREESRGMRWVKFRRWLYYMLGPGRAEPIDLVVYEAPHHRGGAPTEVGIGFSTRVQELCADLAVEYKGVHSTTLKKWTTGKGNAKKPDMLEAVARRFGRRVDDDNEADAIALLHYALAEIAPAQSSAPARSAEGATQTESQPATPLSPRGPRTNGKGFGGTRQSARGLAPDA